MYTPVHFREDRLALLHEAIRQTRLATLVTLGGEGLEASHVPVLFDPGGAFWNSLRPCRAGNPQWQRFAPAVPPWPSSSGRTPTSAPPGTPPGAQTGKVVPTWNYVAVHAYGGLEFFEEADRLLERSSPLTERQEARRSEPWAVTDAPEDYVRAI